MLVTLTVINQITQMDVKLIEETCAQGEHILKEPTPAWEDKEGISGFKSVSGDVISQSASVGE